MPVLCTALLLQSVPGLQQPFAGDPLESWLWFGGLVIAALLLYKYLAGWISRLLCALGSRFTTGAQGSLLRSLIAGPLQGLMLTLMFYIALNQLSKPFEWVLLRRRFQGKLVHVRLIDVIDHIFLFCIIIFVSLLISRTIDFIYAYQSNQARSQGNKNKVQLLPLLKDMAKLLVWALAFFWMLGMVFHVNIPALITGLGIGGVAIALAGKETVENLFASFTILADKPFQADDVIKLGNFEGRVERIGFRSTRLRHASGNLIIIPNKKLIDENLENLSERSHSRVQLFLTVKNTMPAEALEQLMDALRNMLSETEGISEPVSVSLEQFGETAFQILLSYHLPHTAPDAAAVKQRVSLQAYALAGRYAALPPAQAG